MSVFINHSKRQAICEDLESIAHKMSDLIQEARDLLTDHPSYSNWSAYVFEHLEENVENGNPYNQSLMSIIDRLNIDESKKDFELVEEWGEYVDEEES